MGCGNFSSARSEVSDVSSKVMMRVRVRVRRYFIRWISS
jgi:hypothetical protein